MWWWIDCLYPGGCPGDLDLFRGKNRAVYFHQLGICVSDPGGKPAHPGSTPLENPVWAYSRNKIACEELLLQEYRRNKFPFTIVRPSHTYDQTLVPVEGGYTVIDRMMQGKPVIVHGDGTSIWTLTHSADFARGFVGLLGNSHARGEIFHITSEEWLTWNQIYRLLAEAAGVTPNLVHIPSDLIAAYDSRIGDSLLGDKAHSAIFDNSKIRQVVPGFFASIPFSRGAEEIIAWYRADRSRQKVDDAFNNLCDRLIENYRKVFPGNG